ncbi:MAG: dihydroorotate dehydrogenase [Nitrososphaerales archaeon]
MKPDLKLSQEICGIKMLSPTMLASGVLGISFDLFPRILASGCGAVVSKSIGLEPREGYKNPAMTGVEAGYLNAIGLANPGVEEFARELEESPGIPLIVSIFADSEEHLGELAARLEKYNILAFELNLSCPHVKQVGSEIGTDPDEASRVIKRVKRSTRKPVLAKMPASIANVSEWASKVEKAGADAIVAINTIRAMKIDIQSRKPVLSNKIGGLSGPSIKPVGVRCVYEIYEAADIPVIGVGGVSTWEDAVEYILAGASCVQIGSAMATTYLRTFSEINHGLGGYMQHYGFSNLKEMVGIAHN